MRLEAVKREVSSAGQMQVARATIKATPKIFDMFANDTYANKPLAIMRELVANGIDAHATAGRADRPVEVTLPTPFEPTCTIRDFGTGMHHDFVMGPFMAYTDGSTKDKDDGAIGGFGIGSKSPFAYVDQYTLRVVHDQILSVYTMFKDEDGIPAIGLQAQTTTDEPNGVEVSFPVEDADMETFATAAQQALQYFRPLPIVNNGTLTPPEYTYTGNDWAIRKSAGELGIIMGGVRYPATAASMSYELRTDKRLAPLLTYGLDLTMPIGSCGVAMSREQLSYVPKTSESIKAKLEAVVDDVVKTFASFFENCSTEWEAMKLLYKETGGANSYNRSSRANLLLGNAKFKGNKLETGFRIEPTDFKLVGLRADKVQAWAIAPMRSRRSALCPTPKWDTAGALYTVTPGEIEQVIIDDLPQSPKSKTIARVRQYIDTTSQVNTTIVLRGEDEHQVAKLTQLMRSPNVVLTSSLPEPAPKAKAAASTRPRVRMFTFNGGKDRFTHSPINNLTPANSKSDAVKEVPYLNQPASGIMVVMNSFDLPTDFHAKMSTKLVAFTDLVFVNIADAPKIKDNFKNFEDVFKARLDAALAKHPDLPERIALSNHPVMVKYPFSHELMRIDGRYNDLTPAQLARPLGRLVTLWRKYIKPLDEQQRAFGPFVTAKMPAGADPTKLMEALNAVQPDVRILLKVLDLDKGDHLWLLIKNL